MNSTRRPEFYVAAKTSTTHRRLQKQNRSPECVCVFSSRAEKVCVSAKKETYVRNASKQPAGVEKEEERSSSKNREKTSSSSPSPEIFEIFFPDPVRDAKEPRPRSISRSTAERVHRPVKVLPCS